MIARPAGPLSWMLSVLLLAVCNPTRLSASETDDSVFVLDRLVVSTATRTERLLSEAPVRTELLLSEDIRMRCAINFSQAIELVNGIRVESNCQNCNTTEVQLLGLGGAYNQILFDGTPLLSALGSVYGLDQVPAGFIDRVEIVKGGGSALYGPDAVAGVINLIPVAPRSPGGFVQAGIEFQKDEPVYLGSARADLVALGGKLAISITGQGERTDGIDFNDDGYTEITEKRLVTGSIMAWFRPTQDTTLRANYQYIHEDRRGGNRLDEPEYLANIAESLKTRYHRATLSWNQRLSDSANFHVGYSFVHIDRDSFYGGLGDVITDPSDPAYDPAQLDPTFPGSAASASFDQYGNTRNPLHYIDTQFNLLAGTHAIAFGVQYKRESVRDKNLNYLGDTLRVTSDETFSNAGVFVQDEWSVNNTLSILAGVRVDKNSELDDPVFSPRIALTLDATSTLKLRTAISTGFRAPEIFSEDLHVETLGSDQIRIRNAEGLSEERAISWMAGMEWRPSTNARWAVDATISYTDIRDAFMLGEIQSDPDGSLYQERINASGSRIIGAELNLIARPHRTLNITGGFSYYNSKYDDPEVIFDNTSGGGTTVIATRDYLKTPDWSAVAQVVWKPVGKWDFFAGLKYTGPMRVLNNTVGDLRRTRNFWILDLGIIHHLNIGRGQHLDISLGVKNLLDQRQSDLETGAERDSTYVYGPRYARSLYAVIKYEF